MTLRIFAIAASSLRFRWLRSTLTVGAVALATAMVASTLGFRRGYEDSLDRNIEAMGYQVLVTGKGCPHEAATLILRGGSIPMYIQEDVARFVCSQPEVEDATRFFMQSVPEDDGRSSRLWTGIDDRFLDLKPGVRFQRGGWFSSPSAEEVVLGYNVAEYLRLGIGDSLEALGRSFSVVGVIDELGTQDDGTIFLPLELAQTVFERRDRLTGIGLRLRDLAEAPGLIDRLYGVPALQVVRMSQVQSTILGILDGVRGFLYAFGSLALLVALAGVFNVSLLAAQERTAEMGLLRALGCEGSRLFALVWSESILLGGAGGLVGIALAGLLRGGVEAFVRGTLAFVPAGPVVSLTPAILAGSAGAALALASVAGAYPALRAIRVSPRAALRGAVG